MATFAYLAPVGPFAGLSNCARRRIAALFPDLPFADVDGAAERFSLALQGSAANARLAEARAELEFLGRECVRFEVAIERIHLHRLEGPLSEASRKMGGAAVQTVRQALQALQSACRHLARSLPANSAQLASRTLVGDLAALLQCGAMMFHAERRQELVVLVDLILEDLMVGGNAEAAVAEWQASRAAGGQRDVRELIELLRQSSQQASAADETTLANNGPSIVKLTHGRLVG